MLAPPITPRLSGEISEGKNEETLVYAPTVSLADWALFVGGWKLPRITLGKAADGKARVHIDR